MATIILTGGGSAGHCTPHLALLPYLKNDFDKIYYIGSQNGIEKNIIKSAGIPYFWVDCAKFNRKFTLKNLTIPFKLFKGIKQAGKLLDKLKPNVVFSKGGYVSLPVVLACKKRKIPVVCHESDYSVGLTNKICAKYSKKVLTSFPHTALTIKRGEYVGPPIRQNLFYPDREKAKKAFNISSDKPVLLVTGGSQGSQVINKCVRESLLGLIEKFNVIHICGKGNLDPNYKYKGYIQLEYTSEIEKAYALCDLCISRAGSNTVFELLSLNIPCLLIPLPKGNSRGDQMLNANYFYKKGLVSIIFQNLLTPQSLINQVNCIYHNRLNIKKTIQKHQIKDASREISRIIADCMQ